MNVTFYGAVREVTGSMHLITSGNDHILLDCGMFQGRRKESAEKNRTLPMAADSITNVILSHAHIDHSGRIPLLVRNGFAGRVICTRATQDACGYLLPDSAHIQESDANYLNYKTVRAVLSKLETRKGLTRTQKSKAADLKKRLKHEGHRLNTDKINELIQTHGLENVSPLYTMADADAALACFDGYPYRHSVTVGKGATCTFYEAGHILGSAVSIVRFQGNEGAKTICYTGDIGRFNKPILRNPASDFAPEHREVDLMIMESTYGDRLHEPVADMKPALKQILTETFERGGSVIIPAFAYGRTQSLLYILHELYDEGAVTPVPIYVDSPLATNITRVFGEHPEVYDRDTHEAFLQKGKNPFSFQQVRFVGSVEESMAVNRDERPHIVIAASGMCEAGRVLHHLRHKIHNPKNTILIVGFMAQHTLGRRILEMGTAYETAGRKGAAPVLRFLNKDYPLKARVKKIGGFSAHGDREEMTTFLENSGMNIKRIAVVHGEEQQSLAFADHLARAGRDVFVPRPFETVVV
ncbi:MAG: MBL fold metallo-hydrolase [Desulfobacterales bacterium]|nr:MBL fold metallo-hydrolase [Desulfobacterales bacterium]